MISLEEWQNLLNYYILCLEEERLQGSYFDKSLNDQKFISNFTQQEVLFTKNYLSPKDNNASSSYNAIEIPLTTRLNNFLYSKHKENSNHLFYAYPFIFYRNGKIFPLFTAEVTWKKTENNNTVTLTNMAQFPEFNYSLLSYEVIPPEHINRIINNIRQIQRETYPVSGDKKHWDLVKTALEFTSLEEQTLPYTSQLDRFVVNNIENTVVFNQALLFWGERFSWITQLVDELCELRNEKYYLQIKDTSLAYLFDRLPFTTPGIKPKIYQALPLNPRQAEAISKSLQDPFTVVTGPPGTGKSQVLANLIINGVIYDKTVLFASKNNKAVDVVFDRLCAVTDNEESFVVRSGSKEVREKAFETLRGKLTRVIYEDDTSRYEELKPEADVLFFKN